MKYVNAVYYRTSSYLLNCLDCVGVGWGYWTIAVIHALNEQITASLTVGSVTGIGSILLRDPISWILTFRCRSANMPECELRTNPVLDILINDVYLY